jgi:hypothetical protein
MGYPAKMPNEDKRQEMKDRRQLVGNVYRIKIQSFHMRTQIQEDTVTNRRKYMHNIDMTNTAQKIKGITRNDMA